MGVLEDKVELFDSRLLVETFRQWIVLILYLAIFFVLFISSVNLIRNHRRLFEADVILLLLLQLRVGLLLLSEFLIPHRFVLFCSDLVHMTILMIIFYKFTQNILMDKSGVFSMYKTFVGVIAVFILGVLSFGLIKFKSNFECSDSNPRDNYAIFIMQGLEVCMTMLNLCLTFKITNELTKRAHNAMSPEQTDVLHRVFQTKEDLKLTKIQIRVLLWGLLVYTTVNTPLSLIGDFVIYPDQNGFKCMHSWFFMPISNDRALFLLVMNLISVVPPILFWYVIYFSLVQHGKIAPFLRKGKRIYVDSSSKTYSINLMLDEDIEQINQPFISEDRSPNFKTKSDSNDFTTLYCEKEYGSPNLNPSDVFESEEETQDNFQTDQITKFPKDSLSANNQVVSFEEVMRTNFEHKNRKPSARETKRQMANLRATSSISGKFSGDHEPSL